MKERKPNRAMPHEFQILSFEALEKLASGDCPCCGEPFCAAEPPDLTGRCHTGPVFASYWGGYILLCCGECRKPIGRIKVEGA